MAKDIAKTDIYQSATPIRSNTNLEEMSEFEFDLMEATIKEKECSHSEILKLVYGGMHSSYGCRFCKKKSLNLQDFEK